MKSPIPIKPICCCIRSTGNRAGEFSLADMNGPGKESMKRKYKIAMVQMDTQNNKEKNLEDACAGSTRRRLRGRSWWLSRGHEPIGKNTIPGGGREPIPGYSTGRLMEKAAEHGIYIHGGSITEEIPGEKRACNTSVLIGPDGGILARYRKLHTFDITRPTAGRSGNRTGSALDT